MNATARGRTVVILCGALLLLVACDTPDRSEEGTLLVVAMAGPTCPVETDPPDPECAPQPVPDAPIAVSTPGGREVVAEGVTDADGRLTLAVPAGDYRVTAGSVEGLAGTPEPVVVSVVAGITIEVPLGYDTGIR